MSAPARQPTRTVSAIVLVAGIGAPLAHAADPAREPLVWDEGHVLSQVDRSAIEARLRAANADSDHPVFVLMQRKLPGSLAALSLPAYAERMLVERVRPVTARPDPVLLVVIAGPPLRAELATGKGNAGIVPEIDARRITRQLARRRPARSFRVALLSAVDDIVRSMQDTVERRRPSPSDDVAAVEAAVTASQAQGQLATEGDGASHPGGAAAIRPAAAVAAASARAPETSKSRRFPLAIAATVLIILALALRRRKQLASASPSSPPTAPARRSGPTEIPPRDQQRRGPRSPPRS